MRRACSYLLLAVLWLAACLERDPGYEDTTTDDTTGMPSGSTGPGTTDGGTSTPGTSTAGTSSASSTATETTGATTTSTDATGTTSTTTATSTGSETTGTTSTGTTSTTTTTTTTTTSTTTTPTDTTTTSTPTDMEVCDGVDNDSDGLVDEVSANNVTCGGCTLAQLDDHAYFFCEIAGDWISARPQCQAFGADLVAIEGQAQNDFILASTGYDAWIGFSDQAQEDTWIWVDGTPVTYTNWGGNAPNDGAGGEDCGQMLDAGAWNDDRCTDSIAGFVCWAQHTP